jgi:hypothetical protein
MKHGKQDQQGRSAFNAGNLKTQQPKATCKEPSRIPNKTLDGVKGKAYI